MIGYILQHIGELGTAIVKRKYERGKEIKETDMKIFYSSKSMIESAKAVQYAEMSKVCSNSNSKLENNLGNVLLNFALVRLNKGKRALECVKTA